ncbi:hypothetical protein K449DRAFT_466667 [Hypoxylon sp. EC38]|nr:hypothetical protein K449DRAFT_466667 [Hypoxylon sp. EC38]
MGLGCRAIEPIRTIATPPSRYEKTVLQPYGKVLAVYPSALFNPDTSIPVFAHLAPLSVIVSRGSEILIRHCLAHRDYKNAVIIGQMAECLPKLGRRMPLRISLHSPSQCHAQELNSYRLRSTKHAEIAYFICYEFAHFPVSHTIFEYYTALSYVNQATRCILEGTPTLYLGLGHSVREFGYRDPEAWVPICHGIAGTTESLLKLAGDILFPLSSGKGAEAKRTNHESVTGTGTLTNRDIASRTPLSLMVLGSPRASYVPWLVYQGFTAVGGDSPQTNFIRLMSSDPELGRSLRVRRIRSCWTQLDDDEDKNDHDCDDRQQPRKIPPYQFAAATLEGRSWGRRWH